VFGYHLFNVVVHICSAIMCWWLVRLIFSTLALGPARARPQNDLLAFCAGLIFLTHPIQTQAVTYIVQRAASLATLFYLSSICLYVKSRIIENLGEQGGAFRFYYIGALITAVMAMFTKEMSITLPFIILLFEFYFFKTQESMRWKRLLPFLVTLLIIPLTMFLTKSVNFSEMRRVASAKVVISYWQYLLTEFRVMLTYFRLLFVPLNQNLDYDYPIAQSFLELPVLFSFLFIMFLLYVAIRLFSKYRLISFAILWFFLTLLPESGMIPINDVIFEHRLYLPMFGFSLFLVGISYYLIEQSNRNSSIALLFIMAACFSFLTYYRNFIWKNELTLWDDVIKKSPRKPRAYNQRAYAYQKIGDAESALADFNKAIEILPSYALSYNNRAIEYGKRGDFALAFTNFNKAIEFDPKSAQTYYNRAVAYNLAGKREEAILDYSSAIKLKPYFAAAYHNRGVIYYDKGDFKQAIQDYTKAIEIESNSYLSYLNRGSIYLEKGDFEKAISDFTKAIEIEPGLISAYQMRAKAYFSIGESGKYARDVQKLKSLGTVLDKDSP
jgi:tetratricopeptide (TPR) repeat protein